LTSFVVCATCTRNQRPGTSPSSPNRAVPGAPPSSSRSCHCTSSTPPHRRQRAPGELCDVFLLLPVQTASQIVHRSAQTTISGESPVSRRRPAAGAGRLPTARRPHATGAVRWARTTQIKRGVYPLDRSTVDRWTKSRGAGPRTTTATRHACVIPATHSPPRGAPSAPPPAAQAFLQISPCSFEYHKNALPLIGIFSIRSCFFCLSPCPF
jgi:hypothetical protein